MVRSCNLKKWIYIGRLLKTPEDYNETCMRKVLNRLPVIFIIIWKYIHHRKKDFETLCLTMTAENTFTNSKLVLLLTDFFLIKILRFVFLFWGFCLFACLILVVVFLVLFYLEFFPCFFSFYLFACLGSFFGGWGDSYELCQLSFFLIMIVYFLL